MSYYINIFHLILVYNWEIIKKKKKQNSEA